MTRRIAAALVLCACTGRTPSAPAPRFGDLMTQVGRRFELLGRAMQAKRWELAEFELGELRETFDDIATAQVPKDVNADIPQLAKAFVPAVVTPLQDAVSKRDAAHASTAFASASQACNGCHQASGRKFIEVPDKPGEVVPRIDPLP